MNKKISLLLALVLTTVLGLSAQKFSGRWNLYPSVGRTIDQVVNTGSKVFYVTSSRLYHYSEADAETFSYAGSDKLSDVEVSKIFFNPNTRQLLVVYASSNLDIIDEDGSVQNVSAIRDAILSTTKNVIDVAFYDDMAYIATDFGLVVVNMKNGTVQQSGIYGFAPSMVAVTNDYVILYFKYNIASAGIQEYSIFEAPRNGKLSSFSAFKLLQREPFSQFEELDESRLVLLRQSANHARIVTVNPETGAFLQKDVPIDNISRITIGVDGKIYALSSANLYQIDPDQLAASETVALPANVTASTISVGKKGLADVWGAGTSGIGKYDLKSNSILMAPHFPEGISVRYPHLMKWDSAGRLWISNMCASILKSNADGNDGLYHEKYVALIDGDRIEDRTPETHVTSWSISTGGYAFFTPTAEEKARYQEEMWRTQWSHIVKEDRMKTPLIAGGANELQPDPDDPDKFWITCAAEGMYLCEKQDGCSPTNPQGDALALYSRINMPYDDGGGGYTRAYNVNIDPEGNLWQFFRGGPKEPITIMPASLRKTRPERVKYEEWITHSFKDPNTLYTDIQSCFSTTTGMLFLTSSCYAGPIYAVDTKGTYLNPDDDVVIAHTSLLDQDGSPVSPLYYTSVVEDKTGQIWVGTTSGLFVIPDPQAAASETMRVRRPVVPRNDGTNYGDYLLDGANISCIAVDATNRKWIGTADGGVYLVSPDGTKEISHFDKDNSPLPTNVIYSIACDPASNRVFFGTDLGVMSYESDASPAQADFSDVYVYPNPVRPEYNGWITVAGLMDNSLVKIADMSGNVVHQGRSSGGSFVWDGCNSAGERVRTGVYLVLASAGDDNTSASAIVSKIMIMN
ncbi:MAG: hypothetical protein K2M06_00720 [Muribaculaceae bacterium]|nr:hypothetical protein [Muribaculaceae bacterium]